MVHGILVPPSGIKPAHLCIGRQSLNHWTTGEAPSFERRQPALPRGQEPLASHELWVPSLELQFSHLCVRAKSLQSCPTVCDPMNYSPPGFSVHGILPARILERVAISFSISHLQMGPIIFFLLHARRIIKSVCMLDFPGGTVNDNLPAHAEDTGSIPGPGIFHMLQSH